MNYDKTIDYLYGLQVHGIKLGLENPIKLLEIFSHPQLSFKSIHLAGTNGKGSTAAMLHSMLVASGLRAGLFTSPHMLSFTERIKVDNKEITEAEVVRLADIIKNKAHKAGLTPTFFEVITIMGFLHFAQLNAKWAVVETGMGGRLDATNVLNPQAVIITPIGIDHIEFLGNSIQEIAAEKAGIIKEGVPVICAPQEPSALRVIKQTAKSLNAPLHLAGRDFSYEYLAGNNQLKYSSDNLTIEGLNLPLRGAHQAMNAAMAIRCFELVSSAQEQTIKKGMDNLRWPGRFELVASSPNIYIDGAHNPEAARALSVELKANPLNDLTLIMGVMDDKEIPKIIGALMPLAKRIIFTAPAYGRSARPEKLVGIAKEMGFDSEAYQTVAEAIAKAQSDAQANVLVTGSFYTLGETLEALGHKSVLGTLREWQATK